MSEYAVGPDGNVIHRLTEVTVPVQLVQEGDLLFDIPVRHSEPESDFIWLLDAFTDDEEAGIRLLITNNRPVSVKRWLPLEEGQCIDCGRKPVKYAARRQCSACYQREHRAARKQHTPEQMALPLAPVGHHRKQAMRRINRQRSAG